jgi:hypothetical protein
VKSEIRRLQKKLGLFMKTIRIWDIAESGMNWTDTTILMLMINESYGFAAKNIFSLRSNGNPRAVQGAVLTRLISQRII